jgi:hypothetical protein
LISAALENWGFTAQSIGHSDLAREPALPRAVKMPIWAFFAHGERVECDKPVQISLSEEPSGFNAECERLHVFAHGESPDDCIRQLHEQVIYFFNSYSALSEDQVSGLARELRLIYIEHFRAAAVRRH